MWATTEETIASKIFDKGPAKEMIAASRRGFSRLKGSNWTGFPQPKRKRRSIKVPRGSRCFKGFKVRRPWILGVGSPRRSAVSACANSWTVIAASNVGITKRSSIGFLSNDSMLIERTVSGTVYRL